MNNEYNGYKIESDGTYSMKLIKPLGKGSVPEDLRGSYTSLREAEFAIDRYSEGKGKKNAKATKSS